MPAPSPPDVPVWEQVGAVVAFIGGCFGVIRSAWKREEKDHSDHHSDAVVISAAFADGQPIKELTAAVKENTAITERTGSYTQDLAEAVERFNRSQAARSGELREGITGTNERLDRIAEAIGKGVKVTIAPSA